VSVARWDAVVLDAKDAVATALRTLAAGETVTVRYPEGSASLQVAEDIPLCHKVSLAELPPGTLVRKYGEVIGETTAAVQGGAHVHVHNLRSLRARAG
jgi:altronate dehydratase small subunit